MHRQGLGLHVLHQAEDGAEEANADAHIHQRGAADAAQPVKLDPAQSRECEYPPRPRKRWEKQQVQRPKLRTGAMFSIYA